VNSWLIHNPTIAKAEVVFRLHSPS
jgi:hypothetical protein